MDCTKKVGMEDKMGHNQEHTEISKCNIYPDFKAIFTCSKSYLHVNDILPARKIPPLFFCPGKDDGNEGIDEGEVRVGRGKSIVQEGLMRKVKEGCESHRRREGLWEEGQVKR